MSPNDEAFVARMRHTEFANRIAMALGLDPADEIPFDRLVAAVRERIMHLEAKIQWLRDGKPTDPDGCYVIADGTCISDGPCAHTRHVT